MFKQFDLVVVGAGLFGAVVAEQASRAGYRVAVVESRNHIGGTAPAQVKQAIARARKSLA